MVDDAQTHPCAARHRPPRNPSRSVSHPTLFTAEAARSASGCLIGPRSVQSARARPCAAQQENPRRAPSLSSKRELSLRGISASATSTRARAGLRLSLDDIAELSHREFGKPRPQCIDRLVVAEHRE